MKIHPYNSFDKYIRIGDYIKLDYDDVDRKEVELLAQKISRLDEVYSLLEELRKSFSYSNGAGIELRKLFKILDEIKKN